MAVSFLKRIFTKDLVVLEQRVRALPQELREKIALILVEQGISIREIWAIVQSDPRLAKIILTRASQHLSQSLDLPATKIYAAAKRVLLGISCLSGPQSETFFEIVQQDLASNGQLRQTIAITLPEVSPDWIQRAKPLSHIHTPQALEDLLLRNTPDDWLTFSALGLYTDFFCNRSRFPWADRNPLINLTNSMLYYCQQLPEDLQDRIVSCVATTAADSDIVWESTGPEIVKALCKTKNTDQLVRTIKWLWGLKLSKKAFSGSPSSCLRKSPNVSQFEELLLKVFTVDEGKARETATSMDKRGRRERGTDLYFRFKLPPTL